MHLHLRKLFGSLHSHNHGHRTDLCRSYTMSLEERAAQGYSCRSEWAWDNSWLLYLTHHAATAIAQKTAEIDWQTWTVQSECSKIHRYQFEDLDQTDQKMCVVFWRALSEHREILFDSTKSEHLEPVGVVIAQLKRFKEQAEQLYGIYQHTEATLDSVRRGNVFIVMSREES